MSNPNTPEQPTSEEPNESFRDILSQYERSHSHKPEEGGKQLEGTVIAVSDESVFLDIGFKTEGVLPLAAFQSAGETVKPGDKIAVAVKGRNAEGYYELSRFKVELPTDWSALEQAFASKATIVGTITGVVKGGFSVDVGVRAFMPASRSGFRGDAAEMEKLGGRRSAAASPSSTWPTKTWWWTAAWLPKKRSAPFGSAGTPN
jgi:small subunit ribosomal protein S1